MHKSNSAECLEKIAYKYVPATLYVYVMAINQLFICWYACTNGAAINQKLEHNLHDENSKRVHIVINMHIQRQPFIRLLCHHHPNYGQNVYACVWSAREKGKMNFCKDFNMSNGAH